MVHITRMIRSVFVSMVWMTLRLAHRVVRALGVVTRAILTIMMLLVVWLRLGCAVVVVVLALVLWRMGVSSVGLWVMLAMFIVNSRGLIAWGLCMRRMMFLTAFMLSIWNPIFQSGILGLLLSFGHFANIFAVHIVKDITKVVFHYAYLILN